MHSTYKNGLHRGRKEDRSKRCMMRGSDSRYKYRVMGGEE